MPTLTLSIAKLRHYRSKAKTGIGHSYMPLIIEGSDGSETGQKDRNNIVKQVLGQLDLQGRRSRADYRQDACEV